MVFFGVVFVRRLRVMWFVIGMEASLHYYAHPCFNLHPVSARLCVMNNHSVLNTSFQASSERSVSAYTLS